MNHRQSERNKFNRKERKRNGHKKENQTDRRTEDGLVGAVKGAGPAVMTVSECYWSSAKTTSVKHGLTEEWRC